MSATVYVAMLTYNLTEWDFFDENLIGVYSTEDAAKNACKAEADDDIQFFHNPARRGFWIAEDHSYNPTRTTWFYVFKQQVQ